MSDLQELIAQYKQLLSISPKGTAVEFEVIIQTDANQPGVRPGQFINVYLALLEEATKQPTELMVDKIHNRLADDKLIKHNTSRLTQTYASIAGKYKRTAINGMIKNRRAPYIGDGYKVVLSTEETFDPAGGLGESTSNDIARIKVRNTFIKWSKAPNWKIDITAVSKMKWNNKIEFMNATIKNIFDSWKEKPTIDNLNKFNSFEVEAEFIGDNLTQEEITSIITALTNLVKFGMRDPAIVADEQKLFNAMTDLVKYIKPNKNIIKPTIKKVMNNAIELNVLTYNEIFPPLGWFITDKADGVHAVLFVSDVLKIIMADEVIEHQSKTKVSHQTILDVEAVKSTEGGKWTFYVFDVLIFKDNNVMDFPFSRRREHLIPAAEYVSELFGIKVVAKPFIQLPIVVPETTSLEEELKKPIMEMFERRRDYEIDGLIINSPDANYNNTRIFKWKPKSTIDFLAKKCPAELINSFNAVEGKTLYLLFLSINYEVYMSSGINVIDGYEIIFPQYSIKHRGGIQIRPSGGSSSVFPIQFSPISFPSAYLYYAEQNDLDSKIVELSAEHVSAGKPVPWHLENIREDRQIDVSAGGYFGNFYKIAESSWQNILNPFTIDQLWKPKVVYFRQTKDVSFKPATAMNSIIKSFMFDQLAPTIKFEHDTKKIITLLDIAAGRGADLVRYSNAGFTNIVAIDTDQHALAELARRRYEIKFSKHPPVINTLHIDINKVYQTVIDNLELLGLPLQYDAISCNFAIHYLNVSNLAKLVSVLLKSGGRFGFTCLDGARVIEAFNKENVNFGESWRRMDETNTNVKYEIKKMFHSTALEKNGQLIKVRVPFSDELYEENLVNIDEVISVFEKNKLLLKVRKHFSDFLGDVEAENPVITKKLDPADIEYNGLYEFVILEKK